MTKARVIVTRRWPEQVEEKLKKTFDVELDGSDKPFSEAELKDAFSNVDAVFPTVTDTINAKGLSAESMRARLIGNFGVGYNNIDLSAAKKRGLVVTNTPEILTDTTADIAMTLLLSVARRTGAGKRHVRNGEWTG